MTWYSQSFFYTLAGAGYWIFFFIPELVRVARWSDYRSFDIKRLVKRVTTLVSKVPWRQVSEIMAVEGGKPDTSQRGKIGNLNRRSNKEAISVRTLYLGKGYVDRK